MDHYALDHALAVAGELQVLGLVDEKESSPIS
jgi:hypothetical protein